jgi:molybdenum cofactor cytidylyltransferase
LNERNGSGGLPESAAEGSQRDAAPESEAEEGACWALLLAAGEGRRFGGRKLLATLAGRPLVDHALSAIDLARMEGALAGGIAVVPTGEPELRALAEGRDLLAVENTDPEAGLSRSLRVGLVALDGGDLAPPPQAALIVLADQPLLRAGVIASLVAAWRAGGASCVRPRYADHPDEPGHPVLIDRALWEVAGSLRGDEGLGPLLASHPGWVTLVDVTGANPDIDERSDLESLEGRI